MIALPPPAVPAAIERAAAICEAISSPLRLKLLLALADGAMVVNALADAVEKPQPHVSGSLAKLKALGLVTCRVEGHRRPHELTPAGRLAATMARQLGCP